MIRFLIGFISKGSFRLTPKCRQLPHTPSHTFTISATINIPQQSGTFVTMDEPTLIQHYHLKSSLQEIIIFSNVKTHLCIQLYVDAQMHMFKSKMEYTEKSYCTMLVEHVRVQEPSFQTVSTIIFSLQYKVAGKKQQKDSFLFCSKRRDTLK